LRDDTRIIVMRVLVAGIHDFVCSAKTWMAGHRRAKTTPSFRRLAPAMAI